MPPLPKERVNLISIESIIEIEYLKKIDETNTAYLTQTLLLETSNCRYSGIRENIAKLLNIFLFAK